MSPAAHYWMGGVCTDLRGRTSVPGLYAAGEVARTGADLDAAATQLAQWSADFEAVDLEAADVEAGDFESGVRAGHSVRHSVWRSQSAHEDRNLLLAARLLVAAALNRTQSVGAHYRADTDDASALTHSMQRISS